jgi:hypothetical protein
LKNLPVCKIDVREGLTWHPFFRASQTVFLCPQDVTPKGKRTKVENLFSFPVWPNLGLRKRVSWSLKIFFAQHFDGGNETTQDQKDIVVEKVVLKGQHRALRPTSFIIIFLLPWLTSYVPQSVEKTH